MVVRRSPLDSAHARLGARWNAPEARWPVDYGDPAREADTARLAGGLTEFGPVGKIAVRGSGIEGAIAEAGGQYLPSTLAVTYDLKAEASATSGVWGEVWGLGPADGMVVCEAPGGVRALLERPGVAAVDLSSGLSLQRLVGPVATAVLSELCPLDLGDRSFPDFRVVQTPIANVRVILARLDWRDTPGYAFLVARDYAEYLWDALLEAGRPHGLAAVGARAIEAGLER